MNEIFGPDLLNDRVKNNLLRNKWTRLTYPPAAPFITIDLSHPLDGREKKSHSRLFNQSESSWTS